MQDVYLSNPDEWFLKMLEAPKDGDFCPDFLRGIWWMQDNIANETVVSLESAHWGRPDGPNPEVGMKHAPRSFQKSFFRDLLRFSCVDVHWVMLSM